MTEPSRFSSGSSAGTRGTVATPRNCPVCTAAAIPSALYCEACGAPLDDSAGSSPVQADPVSSASALVCDGCGTPVTEGAEFCEDCGRRMPHPRDRIESDLGVLAAVSDRGLVHARNEDAFALARVELPGAAEGLIAVVCDGVSQTLRSDEASQAASQVGRDALVSALRGGIGPEAATRTATAAAVLATVELARSGDAGQAPSCTYVSAVVTPTSVTAGCVGDSRAYWLAAPDGGGGPDGGEKKAAATPSACLTRDDTVTSELVALGVLDEAAAAADPRAHTLSRWLGADGAHPEAHVTTIAPACPGVVLVCTDGLWNYLPDADSLAAEVLPSALDDPAGAARKLVRTALLAGGHDNVTVAVIPFRTRTGASDDGLGAGAPSESARQEAARQETARHETAEHETARQEAAPPHTTESPA